MGWGVAMAATRPLAMRGRRGRAWGASPDRAEHSGGSTEGTIAAT